MENQEINLEKVHRLIDSLQSQAAEANTQGMLSAAQLIVAELQHIQAQHRAPGHKNGNVSVVMPFAGKPLVNQVRAEAPREDLSADRSASMQPPTIITETGPGEATDNHSFGSIPAPPVPDSIPATEKSTEPVQKELFELAEENEEAGLSPLTAAQYPTSIPDDQPEIQQRSESIPAVTQTGRPAQTEQHISNQEGQVTEPSTSIQSPTEQAPDFDPAIPAKTPEIPLQIHQSEEDKKRHLAFISDNFSTWADYGMSGEAPTLVQNQPLVTDTGSDYNNSYQQQQPYKELNEQLGQPQEEWAHKMQSTPIENLASAIGVNDRYLYISELFRGDESMYERSIITLNKFNNFHEAHAWSERELRLKLGWDTQNPITRQFEQLIKRRFMQKA